MFKSMQEYNSHGISHNDVVLTSCFNRW